MKNIVFLAPPAAGKGTQSDLLVKKYGYVHISTGDLLREEVNTGSSLGKEIDERIKNGLFVDNDIVSSLIKKRLMQDDIKNGFILDGYPRYTEQAKSLESIINELNLKIDVAIYLDLDQESSMNRALGRIICPKCKRSYNKYEEILKPHEEGLCDDCHVALESRTDDTEETFKKRFDLYTNDTKPLLEYYGGEGILHIIDNSGTPEETFKQIEGVIND